MHSLVARSLALSALTFTLAAGAGCKSHPSTEAVGESTLSRAAVTPASGASAAPADDSPRGQAERIATTPPPGASPVDGEVRAAQVFAKRFYQKEEAWILLGQAWVKEARTLADPGFYVNANAAAAVALDIAPESRMAYDLQALVFMNDHKFKEALAREDDVLAKDPQDAKALGTSSDALLELGQFDEAAARAQRMVDLKPDLPSYSRASYFRWLQGDSKMAKAFARKAIDASAVSGDVEPRAWEIVQAALLFWHEGDYDGSGAGFDQALNLKGEYAPALVGKGLVAMAKGDGAKAAEYFTRAYAQSPLVQTAWLLGDAKTLAGDAKGAGEAYALVESRGKGSDPRTLSLYWSTKGTHAPEALALAQAEMKVRGDIYTQDALAWALYRSGQFAPAKAASDQAIRLGTPDAKLLYHAGAIQIAAGNAKVGTALVAKAVKLNPKFDFTGGSEAQAVLAKHGP